jgi:hypothetical protein
VRGYVFGLRQKCRCHPCGGYAIVVSVHEQHQWCPKIRLKNLGDRLSVTLSVIGVYVFGVAESNDDFFPEGT